MGVRDAVERAEQAPAKPSLAMVVKDAIDRQAEALAQVLPRDVDSGRYGRLVLTAVKATPQLMECFQTTQGQTSVLLAAMQAAAVGLEPNTPTQECWLTPRRVNGQTEAQLSIGYRGYLKLVQRSETVKTIFAEVVREGDEFTWSRGLEEDTLEHHPLDEDGSGPERPLTHAYAVARFHGGGYTFIVLNRRDIDQRRAQSDSWKSERSRPYSPWTKWPAAMWRKSAIRALVPFLQLRPEAAHVAALDDQRLTIDRDTGVIDVIDEDIAELEPAPVQAEQQPSPEAEPEPEPAEPEPPAADAPIPAITARDIGILAGKAFPLDDAPRGTKTSTRDRLRHAVVWAVTNARTYHLDDCEPAEVLKVASRLNDIIDKRMAFTHDDTGVVFTWGDNGELDISWASMEAGPSDEPSPGADEEG